MGINWQWLGMIMIGGALGGMLRLAVSNALARLVGSHFPWGTLGVNLSAAAAIGLVAGMLPAPDLSARSLVWYMLVAGLLGGYSTVSSLSLQTLSLWQSGRHQAAIFNMGGTCLGGLMLLALGYWLGRAPW
ncbi:CrcB family protein [Halomonas sediminis]